ncbi:PIR Superfamily Protein [Plasmodium ovale wallikeri]|uniref:PIR Superfamily Protein n=2 Tax=Plasmodium ovale TaxID=36330 RepID=A0A1A8YNS0_PLAOA|nr:PIR Superfamily Protein [Plasmodium ovale wallikeri]SBT58909.1 PIR Superfamily Protein [Plasmodium ovale wallikeri]SBT73695.1 PIR protein [Plasmodium ovale]
MSSFVKFEDIQLLPSKKFYNKLDTLENIYCSVHSEKERIIQDIISKLNVQEHIVNYSDKIVNVLCKTSTLDAVNSECNEHCNYLYYWIGDILFDKLIDVNSFSAITDELHNLMNSVSPQHKCNCKFYFNGINRENFNEIKEAYFYYQNHNYINSILQHYNGRCVDDYNNYLHESYNKYRKVYEACKNVNSERYCNQLKGKDSIYSGEMLPALTCGGVEKPLEYQAIGSQGLVLEPPQEIPDNTSTPKSVIFVSFFFPILGIIFLLLYKFTPLGSWMRSHFLKKRNIHLNTDYIKMPGFLEHFDENEHKNSNIRRYNVGYHSQ